jgi:hypothetical protein
MFLSGHCGHTPRIHRSPGGECNYSIPEPAAARQSPTSACSNEQQLLVGNGIRVTDSQLVLRGHKYPLATIRSITLVERARKAVWAEMSFRAGLFIIVVALLQAFSGEIELTLAGVLAGLILVAIGLFSLLTAKSEYSIQISCATGNVVEIYVTHDKAFLDELIRAVNHLITGVESASG